MEVIVPFDEVLECGFVGGEGSLLEAGGFGGEGLAPFAFDGLSVIH